MGFPLQSFIPCRSHPIECDSPWNEYGHANRHDRFWIRKLKPKNPGFADVYAPEFRKSGIKERRRLILAKLRIRRLHPKIVADQQGHTLDLNLNVYTETSLLSSVLNSERAIEVLPLEEI